MATAQTSTGSSRSTGAKKSNKTATKRASRLDDNEFEAAADAEGDTEGRSERSNGASANVAGLEGFSSAKEMLAERINDFAVQIERFTPKDGVIGTTGNTVVSALTDVGAYLEASEVTDIVADGASFAKRHSVPIALGLAGVGLGLLVSARSIGAAFTAVSDATGSSKKSGGKSGKSRSTSGGNKSRRAAH